MPLRTIIESPETSAELDRLRKEYPRFDDWWVNGWSWRLARDPFEDAVPIPGANPTVYLLKTSPNHPDWGFPFMLTFMYRVTDGEIFLDGIRFVAIDGTADIE
jgi:hypothetical protein